MGYFNEQNALDYDREYDGKGKASKEVTKENLIWAISQFDPTKQKAKLESLSKEKLLVLKKQLDEEQKRRYFAKYGKKDNRFYMDNDEDEEKNRFNR